MLNLSFSFCKEAVYTRPDLPHKATWPVTTYEKIQTTNDFGVYFGQWSHCELTFVSLGLILTTNNYAVLGCFSSHTRWFLACIFMNKQTLSLSPFVSWGFFVNCWGTLSGLHQNIKMSFVLLSLGDNLEELSYVKPVSCSVCFPGQQKSQDIFDRGG